MRPFEAQYCESGRVELSASSWPVLQMTRLGLETGSSRSGLASFCSQALGAAETARPAPPSGVRVFHFSYSKGTVLVCFPLLVRLREVFFFYKSFVCPLVVSFLPLFSLPCWCVEILA